MNDGKVYFLVKTTNNKNLHQYFLCPYCCKYFYSDNKEHGCLSFTQGKQWTEISRFRNDCIFFVLYMYNH